MKLVFQSPVPVWKWEGVRSAVKEGPVCLQESETKKYPVMVFIHGGGFEGGTGNQMLYEPDYLLDRDIVLVTMNYRLGALALKWVKENIAAFRWQSRFGDNIRAKAAGGASVHYHMISPLSQEMVNMDPVTAGITPVYRARRMCSCPGPKGLQYYLG
ncbi:hypothetical protein LSTR_LSTR017366 [Laodelphax striatellus]|uniref:Carboxylesterase type B domain-containing protein n=1 Tax=Laodelphax striatellus TaxID=195883 RepID=A0A482XF73_LAOST|nr:hypothetical protein LSTR_LSTR017366 [Laodelphax striatellus]